MPPPTLKKWQQFALFVIAWEKSLVCRIRMGSSKIILDDLELRHTPPADEEASAERGRGGGRGAEIWLEGRSRVRGSAVSKHSKRKQL